MLLWGMIEEENGLFVGEEGNAPLYDVFKELSDLNGCISVDRGRSQTDRVHSKGDLQKVRKKRSGVKKPQEMGTT
jgi:hypothetical protein